MFYETEEETALNADLTALCEACKNNNLCKEPCSKWNNILSDFTVIIPEKETLSFNLS